jgi:hypothetical protein
MYQKLFLLIQKLVVIIGQELLKNSTPSVSKYNIIKKRVLLTGAPGTLVKHTIKGNYYQTVFDFIIN